MAKTVVKRIRQEQEQRRAEYDRQYEIFWFMATRRIAATDCLMERFEQQRRLQQEHRRNFQLEQYRIDIKNIKFMLYGLGYLAPRPGDLIMVEESEWYALPSGELLRVTEPHRDQAEDAVRYAPRSQCGLYWDNRSGAISSVGGPYGHLMLSTLWQDGLEVESVVSDEFWRFRDGAYSEREDYIAPVVRWRLPLLRCEYRRAKRQEQEAYRAIKLEG